MISYNKFKQFRYVADTTGNVSVKYILPAFFILYLLYEVLCFAGPKHKQRFLCEVRVDGYTYVAAGNSTNKKDAQSNAARDFVSFLVRQGIVNTADVPTDLLAVGGGDNSPTPGM